MAVSSPGSGCEDRPGDPERDRRSDSAPPGLFQSQRLAKALPGICLALLVALHFGFLMSWFAPAISAPDDNGYWAQGSLLFETGRTWFRPESNLQYVGMHWLLTDDGRYFSRYPPGLPVLTGAVQWLLGYKASVLVNPVLAALALVGFWLLLRRFVGPWWSLAGAFVLAVNPVFNQQALWCYAHMAVACCLIWGTYCLVRWSQGGGIGTAFLAGLVFGCIPTIRYPEALFALGVGVFLLWHRRSREGVWRHWAAAALGAAIPIVPLLVRNHLAFGAFYRTGYALTNEQTGFGWSYFLDHFTGYIRGLHGDGAGLFFALGLIGLAAMVWRKELRRVAVLLLLLAVPSTLLYMSYYWGRGQDFGSMRFLTPVFCCYIFGGVWLLSRIVELAPARLRWLPVAAVLLLQFAWGGTNTLDENRRQQYQKRVLVLATDALEETAPRGSVVTGSQQLLQHLDFVRHWRLADLSILQVQGGGRRFGGMGGMGGPGGPGGMFRGRDPDAPSPMQPAKRQARIDAYANLSPAEIAARTVAELGRWGAERKVYFVGVEAELERLSAPGLEKDSFKIVRRIPLPTPPPIASGRGFGFGGRGNLPPMMPPGAATPTPPPTPPAGPDGPPAPPPGAAPPAADARDNRGAAPGRFGGVGGFPMGGFMGRRAGFESAKELVVAEWTGNAPSGGEGGPPAWLATRVKKLRALLDRLAGAGEAPDFFWSPERERKLNDLLDGKKFREANELLDAALKDYKGAQRTTE
jgi:hypothetical protein